MMRRLWTVLPVLAALGGLSACGEKPQVMGGNKGHVAAFEGARNQFVAQGWTPCDKSSWEQGLKARMQRSQNEYSKTN